MERKAVLRKWRGRGEYLSRVRSRRELKKKAFGKLSRRLEKMRAVFEILVPNAVKVAETMAKGLKGE